MRAKTITFWSMRFTEEMRSNETEVSYRHRERAPLEVKMFQSYRNVSVRRVAVSSTDWLDAFIVFITLAQFRE